MSSSKKSTKSRLRYTALLLERDEMMCVQQPLVAKYENAQTFWKVSKGPGHTASNVMESSVNRLGFMEKECLCTFCELQCTVFSLSLQHIQLTIFDITAQAE